MSWSAGPPFETTEGCVDRRVRTSAVWPWLVQMGQDRGGLYSYETLENLVGLHYHNADRIHPEWQRLAAGDVMRLVPKGWMGLREGISMQVVDVVERQSIVLRTVPTEHVSGMRSGRSTSFHIGKIAAGYWSEREYGCITPARYWPRNLPGRQRP